MGKIKLRGKLSGVFGLMGLMLLIGGIIGTFGIFHVSGKLKNISEISHSATYHIGVMSETQIKSQRISRSLLVPETFNNVSERAKQIKDIEESWRHADVSWQQYDQLPRTDEVIAVWKSVKPAWESWHKADQEFIRLIKEGKREDALGLMSARMEESFDASQKLLRDLSDVNMKLAWESGQSGINQAWWMQMLALAGTIFGMIIAICFGFYLARYTTRPIQKVIEELTETSEQFAEAAGQIAQASNHLAEGTSRQANAVDEAFSVINELAAESHLNHQDIQKLKASTYAADKFREEAHNNLKLTAATMKDIKASSEETSGILQTIEKIAFKTNLLALNASVEAARAGEVGAGFAVVADEVRNLAVRSAEAAKNTTQLIGGTVDAIYKGGDLVESTSAKFEDYNEAARKFVTYLDGAAECSGEQLPKFGQIKKSVEEIHRVVQENAASAEEAAAAAEEMTAQCEAMKQYIRELSSVIGGTQKSLSSRLSTDRHDRLKLPPPGISEEFSSPGENLIEEVRP